MSSAYLSARLEHRAHNRNRVPACVSSPSPSPSPESLREKETSHSTETERAVCSRHSSQVSFSREEREREKERESSPLYFMRKIDPQNLTLIVKRGDFSI